MSILRPAVFAERASPVVDDERLAIEVELLAAARLQHRLQTWWLPLPEQRATAALRDIHSPYEFLGHIAATKHGGFGAWLYAWLGPRKRSLAQTWALLLAIADGIYATPALAEACAGTHRATDRGVAYGRVLNELAKDAVVRSWPDASQ